MVSGSSIAIKRRHDSSGFDIGTLSLGSPSHVRNRNSIHGFGASIEISFVALSTAALLKGNGRGVTLRQSSNWSFQCGLLGKPDSPSGIPFWLLSQSVTSAMKRIDTLEPT